MHGRLHLSALLPASATAAVLHTRELHERGMTAASIRAAIALGLLVRVRRGRYLPGDAHPLLLAAAAQGGSVDCVSLLTLLGVFVHLRSHLHIQVPVGASRLPKTRPDITRHWRASAHHPSRPLADLVEAVAQAVRCQAPRAAIATLDSALHLRLLDEQTLDDVFALLPDRHRVLRALVDGRSESGVETFVRLMLRAMGCSFALQVVIDRVGRVDFLVDGWLIIECDSRAHHSDWSSVCRDRRRDLEAAAQGFTTVRLLAEDVLDDPDGTAAMLRRVIRSTPRRPQLLTPAPSRRRARRVAPGAVGI